LLIGESSHTHPMNDRFITEPFAIAPDRLDALNTLSKKHKLIVDKYLIDGMSLVGVRGSCRKHFNPEGSGEFQKLLPQGGVLLYEIGYKSNRYWGLVLKRIWGKFSRTTIQNDDHFSIFADLNKVLSELVKAPPSDGVLFVSAAFSLNNKNNSSLKTLTALADDNGCKLERARFNANKNCFRLSGLVTTKFDPRTCKVMGGCMYDSGGISETLFYFVTFQAGKCTGLQLYYKPCSYRAINNDNVLSLLVDIPLSYGLEGFTSFNTQLVVEVCRD
jgi:hypothetical protein